ncbi:Lactonase, 7-bladed beta-propeller-domain-containing protein [Ampelomyces quisqualis]|uniref:Lactonase, 7-bladed beta-propeller-domain-containing protein n=1 Tax=Ampelomyces quisqualis TaxID=50730 RepID=A0A6A5QHI8_AMPQU|nr:Lactonase, 7-bladed beta-propeller-domain-containing protein [Ampelomyces quisqualis]
MKTVTLLFPLTQVLSTQAFQLLVSSYKSENTTVGALQTLEYSSGKNTSGLRITHTNTDCGSSPSWLELSSDGNTVTCINEGDPGSLTLLDVQCDGSLKMLSNTSTLGGPVSGSFFNNGSAIGLAHYGPVPGVSTFTITSNKTYIPLQNLTAPFANLSSVDPERQKTSHVHQALVDPTGQYMLFPDLGADLIHVYCINASTAQLSAHTPLKSEPGSGPRHAVFWQPTQPAANRTTYLFVVHELSNTIASYAVTYLSPSGLAFDPVDQVSTFGPTAAPRGAAAGEILISPDNAFVLASNRLAPLFHVPNPDPRNATALQSDSLVTFAPSATGSLRFVQLVASGGLGPRHFSLRGDGAMVAVANQGSASVVVYERDQGTGEIGREVVRASGVGAGGVTNVRWLRG